MAPNRTERSEEQKRKTLLTMNKAELAFESSVTWKKDSTVYDMTIPVPLAYRRALQAVREGIGENSYLVICGGLYDAAIGIADSQRTGSDILARWPLTNVVKQNLLRWYMSKWWSNDADCLALRRQSEMTRGLNLTLGLLSDDEIRTFLVNQYLSGGLFSQTEPLETIEDDRLWQVRRLIPLVPIESIPELFDGSTVPSRIVVRGKESGLCELVLINWDDCESWTPTIRPGEILSRWQKTEEKVTEADRCLTVEFYGKRHHIAPSAEEVTLSPIPPHASEVVRIHRYDPDSPYVIGGPHFSLGEEVEELSIMNDKIFFSGNSVFPIPLDYEILLPEYYETEDGSHTIRFHVDSIGQYTKTATLKTVE